MKLVVRFKDGLRNIVEWDAPIGEAGYYVPYEFMAQHPERAEKVLVRSNPIRTQNSKHPVYVEVAGD